MRKLHIILIPVWTIGLILTIIFTIEGIQAIPVYYKAKSLIPKQIELENAVHSRQYQPNATSEKYDFDPTPWTEIGIENPSPYSTMMPQIGMDIQEKKMYRCLSPLIYFIVFFFIPSIILRLTYWVKNAENDTKI